MALKGTNTLNMLSNGRVQSIVEWSATQNKTANTSTITARVYSYFAGAIYASASSNVVVNIGGQSSTVSRVIGNHPNGGKILVATVTKTVSHATNGSLTTNIKVTNPFNVTYSGSYIGSASHNFNITLDRIPRNSTIGTVSNFTSPTNSPSVQIIAADSSFTHIIDFKMNNKTLFSRGGLKGGTHNLALTAAEQDLVLKEMSRVASSTFTVVLGTYNNGTFTGTAQSKNGTVTVASNIVPVINSVTWEDIVGADPTTGDLYLDISRLRIKTSASANKFATIALIEVNYNGFTYRGASVDTDVITSAAPYQEMKVTVTDSRGRKATSTNNVWVGQMNYPIIQTKAYRSGSNGVPDNKGRYLRVIANLATNGGGIGNYWVIQWRKTRASSWNTLESGGEESVWFEQTYNLNLDPNSSYEVRTYVENYLYKNEKIIDIPTDFVTMDVRANGKGLAFGKVSEKDAFEVAFNSEFLGRMGVFTPTDNAMDNQLLRFHRKDGSLFAAFMYNKDRQDLRLHMYENNAWKTSFNFGINGIFTDRKCYIQVAVGTSNSNNTSMTVPAAWGGTSAISWGTALFARNNAFTLQNNNTYVANRDIDVKITLQTLTYSHSVATDISKSIMINGSIKTPSYDRVTTSYAHGVVSILASLKSGDKISCAFAAASAVTFMMYWSTSLTIEEI